jgi:hypothetical protein
MKTNDIISVSGSLSIFRVTAIADGVVYIEGKHGLQQCYPWQVTSSTPAVDSRRKAEMPVHWIPAEKETYQE